MKSVYLDNGATSFPKAPGVSKAIYDYVENIGVNVGRGAYTSAYDAESVVYDTREMINDLFNGPKVENVIFTKNITESLNVIIKGLFSHGDEVIVSSMEHNAVMRPLMAMKDRLGLTIKRVKCSVEGNLILQDLKSKITSKTKAIIMLHSSNVSGTVLDLKSVGEIAKENSIHFIIDAAQTAGLLPVDFETLNASAICFTGHKSLLGPQGIGGFVVNDQLAQELRTFIEGGTGSKSVDEVQPEYMPDKFESGTPNLPGIFGLHASLKYINDTGIDTIRTHEMKLVKCFIEAMETIEGVRIIGHQDFNQKTGVVSLDFTNHDNAMISHELSSSFGISTRCGMHCAPSAHKTLNTFPQGTVRFAFSYFTTIEELDYTIAAIKKLMK